MKQNHGKVVLSAVTRYFSEPQESSAFIYGKLIVLKKEVPSCVDMVKMAFALLYRSKA